MDNSPIYPANKPFAPRFNLYFFGGIDLLVAIFFGIIAYTSLDTAPEVSDARLEKEAVRGPKDAKVRIVEYGAYGCVICRRTHQSGIVEDVLELYGDQVSFTFRNYPIRVKHDPLAAEAAQCALDQGDSAFWTFHNALYALSNADFRSYTEIAPYVTLAEENGLDADALENCLDNATHKRTVEHWDEYGDSINLPGVPTFFVNGRRLNNPSELETAISEALAEAN